MRYHICHVRCCPQTPSFPNSGPRAICPSICLFLSPFALIASSEGACRRDDIVASTPVQTLGSCIPSTLTHAATTSI